MVHPLIFFLSVLDLFAKAKVKFFAPQKEIMYMYLYTREKKCTTLSGGSNIYFLATHFQTNSK